MKKVILILFVFTAVFCFAQNSLQIETYNSNDSIISFELSTNYGDSIKSRVSIEGNSLNTSVYVKGLGLFQDGELASLGEISDNVNRIKQFGDYLIDSGGDTVVQFSSNTVTYFQGATQSVCFVNERNLVDSIYTISPLNNGKFMTVEKEYFIYHFTDRTVRVSQKVEPFDGEYFSRKLTYFFNESIDFGNYNNNIQFWPIHLASYEGVRLHLNRRLH